MRSHIGKLFHVSEWIGLFRAGTRAGQHMKKYDVIVQWEAIVGQSIAAAAKPERIEKQVLTLKVHHAVWRQELLFRKNELIGQINTYFGENIVKDIIFR